MDLEHLLEEQRRYYKERAPEYDDWWFRRGSYSLDAESEAAWFADVAEVEAALDQFAPRGDVVELAAGTGNWTRQLVRYADRVTAVDAVPAVLELNRAKVRTCVDYVVADVFTWEPPRAFDVCFFSFWLSHVPSERVESFWELVARALKPNGRVFLVDNAHLGDPRHLVGASGEVLWLVNGKLEGETRGGGPFEYSFAQVGDQTITALAKSGNYAQLEVRVLR